MDYTKLVDILLDHSTKIKEGEKVLVQMYSLQGMPLAEALFEGIRKRKALPFFHVDSTELLTQQKMTESNELFKIEAQAQYERMKEMDAYIGIRSTPNIFWDVQASKEGKKLYLDNIFHLVHRHRVDKTKWVILNFPTEGLAQDAGMSLSQYTKYWYDASTADYPAMSLAAKGLHKRMNDGKNVKIVAPKMELTFSIENIPAVECGGTHNIPDGEVFTAPVIDSMNGTYYCPSPNFYGGNWFDGISLVFKDGKIIEANCDTGSVDALRSIIFENKNADIVGEWAIGYNPLILKPTSDILFTEKMFGFHMALGNAYEDADNGNRSSVHWDIIYPMNPSQKGESYIMIDDEIVMKNGRFVPTDLLQLNPKD